MEELLEVMMSEDALSQLGPEVVKASEVEALAKDMGVSTQDALKLVKKQKLEDWTVAQIADIVMKTSTSATIPQIARVAVERKHFPDTPEGNAQALEMVRGVFGRRGKKTGSV